MIRRFRSLLRTLKWSAIGLLGLILLYALLAVTLPRITVNSSHRSPKEGVRVFIESNGVHADFIVPVRTSAINWTQHLPVEWFEAVDRSYGYLAFGWGDKGFYLDTPTWSDLEFGTAFKAVFFLGSAAMHVAYVRFEPVPNDRCRLLVLSEDQYRDLTDYLLDSFARDEAGQLLRIDHPGYTPQDRFFDARGRYSLVNTCNEWTGAGLRRIGVRTGLWTPFAPDVLRNLGE